MTAVGLGQQGSQAVGSGFESLSFQIFLRLIPNIFRYPKLVKHKGSLTKFFGTVRQKLFDRKSLYSPHPPLIHKLFCYRKFCETLKGSPTKVFGTVRHKVFDGNS